jgi:hypothetical protein
VRPIDLFLSLLIALIVVSCVWPLRKVRRRPMRFDPDRPYRSYSREFDVEIDADALHAIRDGSMSCCTSSIAAPAKGCRRAIALSDHRVSIGGNAVNVASSRDQGNGFPSPGNSGGGGGRSARGAMSNGSRSSSIVNLPKCIADQSYRANSRAHRAALAVESCATAPKPRHASPDDSCLAGICSTRSVPAGPLPMSASGQNALAWLSPKNVVVPDLDRSQRFDRFKEMLQR